MKETETVREFSDRISKVVSQIRDPSGSKLMTVEMSGKFFQQSGSKQPCMFFQLVLVIPPCGIKG